MIHDVLGLCFFWNHFYLCGRLYLCGVGGSLVINLLSRISPGDSKLIMLIVQNSNKAFERIVKVPSGLWP